MKILTPGSRIHFISSGTFLVLAVLVLAAGGCRGRTTAMGDLPGMFTPSGDRQARVLGIYSGRELVGELRLAREVGTWRGEEPVIQFSEDVDLRLSFRGDRFSVTSSQVSWVGEGMDLKASAGSMDFGAGRWETRVLKVGDRTYEREQLAAGSASRDRIEIPDGVLISDVLPLFIEKAQVETREVIQIGAFNMTLGQEFPLTLEYRGVTDDGRLYALTYWGMEERLWVDDTGMIVREDMALGVSARASNGKDRSGHLALETVLSQTAVAGVGIPDDVGTRDSVVIAMEGSFRTPPEGPWQSVKPFKDRAEIYLTKPLIPPRDLRLPDTKLMPADRFGLDLDSTRIRDLSKELTGPYDDPWDKALAIGQWVHDELGKSMRECFSALQVLETGEGECQSHSLLTVSLSRAAGLPARFAYGVVYLPDRKAFGFHTWVQVHVGEWIPVDPTLGNFPAGVDHLTLAVGGYQDQFRLFPFILGKGGWRIKMQDTERRTQYAE